MEINLKPNEIIFLDFISGKTTDTTFSIYWEAQYGILPQKTIKKFENLGLITLKLDIKRNINQLTITTLKELLKSEELSITGKKQDLVERILGNVDLNKLEKLYNTKSFILSNKAQQIIKDNYIYIINKNKSYNFTDFEIKEAYSKAPTWASDNDIIWGIFNEKNITLINKKDWGLYRNNLHNMGSLLYEEKKYLQALTFFIAVFNIDISGMGNGNYVYSIDSLTTAPAITTKIKNLLIMCDLELSDLPNLTVDAVQYYAILPFKYYNTDISSKILLDCIEGKLFNTKNYPHNIPDENSQKYNYYNFNKYIDNTNENVEVKTKTRDWWKVLLLIIFYPIGICYLIYLIIKKSK